MGINITALTERLRALSDEAYRLCSQDKTQPVDMIRLAKILSRQDQLEMQLAASGIQTNHVKTHTIPLRSEPVWLLLMVKFMPI